MTRQSTLYRCHLELSDIDRNIYESFHVRVACHPSEEQKRMVIRILARVIAHQEALEFGRGLCVPEEPALWIKSLVGGTKLWIDVGLPSAERLHRASKNSDRVMIVTDKEQSALYKEWKSRAIHKADNIEIVQLPAQFIAELSINLQRSIHWYITIQENTISVADGEKSVDAIIQRSIMTDFLHSVPK